MASDLISRSVLLAEYDRVHVGEPGGARKLMEEAPAVDAVEVVRCKDCKYFKFGDYCYHDGAMEHSHARENDFCSYGIRRKKKDAVD